MSIISIIAAIGYTILAGLAGLLVLVMCGLADNARLFCRNHIRDISLKSDKANSTSLEQQDIPPEPPVKRQMIVPAIIFRERKYGSTIHTFSRRIES